jgi:hypothetical protein
MPKHKGLILGGLVLALVALSPTSAAAKAGGTDRPMQGTTLGDVTVTLAPGLPMEADVTGVTTHLGKYTGHLEGTAEIIGGTVFGEGTFTLVAANGDQLSGTFALTGPPPSGAVHPVSTVLTITGGTGRFADASGTITVELVATPSCFNDPSSCPGAVIETIEGPVTGLISY